MRLKKYLRKRTMNGYTRKIKILCIIMFASMLFGHICYFFYTVPNQNEMNKKKPNYDDMYKEYLLKYDFDYFNGVYLDGYILFVVCFLILAQEKEVKNKWKIA